MELSVIGSGSSGNCYILKADNGRCVILDCGLPFREITGSKKFCGFSKIDFVFTSHCHSDHNKSLKDFKKSGCEIVSYETLEQRVDYETLEQQIYKFNIGDWECTTFPVAHNVPCWGIILKFIPTNEKFCYVTDFNKMPIIEGIDHWLMEVNYSMGWIEYKAEHDIDINNKSYLHHHALEDTVEYFEKLRTRPKTITCCHLSSVNAMEGTIIKQLKPFADKINIAKKGETYGDRQ